MKPAKPEFSVDLSTDGTRTLRALVYLQDIASGKLHHEKQNKRHPLGIYNISVNRICRKIAKCCCALEKYMKAANSGQEISQHGDIREEIIDYLELCLYSSAEHVEDISLISECFFEKQKKIPKQITKLKKRIQPIRSRISSFTNSIKHSQTRICLCSIDFTQENHKTCLHGFFIQSVTKGVVGPCPIRHSNKENIISITSFLWEIIIYLYQMSCNLAEFLESIGLPASQNDENLQCKPLCDAVIALMRLPNYSFDEAHPFEKTRFLVTSDENRNEFLDSGLYGSSGKPWSRKNEGRTGSFSLQYEGDGVTKNFSTIAPTKLEVQHWD